MIGGGEGGRGAHECGPFVKLSKRCQPHDRAPTRNAHCQPFVRPRSIDRTLDKIAMESPVDVEKRRDIVKRRMSRLFFLRWLFMPDLRRLHRELLRIENEIDQEVRLM